MSPSTHHIIPENERYCVWMDAGMVDYKLCNFYFRCDECAFDVQIRTRKTASHRNESHPELSPSVHHDKKVDSSFSAEEYCAMTLKNVLRTVDRQALPDDRFYSSNHTWAKEDGSGMVVLGFDHFIGAMLGAGHSIAFSVPPTPVRANEPYAWIVANGETLAVRSPISGTIVENNPALIDRAWAIHTDPYGQGWIARIRPDEEVHDVRFQTAHRFAHALHGSEEVSQAMKNDCDRYARCIVSELQNLQHHLEGTMYDGGIMLDNFEEILGTPVYYRILERFLIP
jgi:glycine cleavage system H lipoate-binding protein